MTQVRDAADRAWQAEILDGGWQAPSAPLDIYIDPALKQGEAFVDEDPSGVTFMALSPDFASDAELESFVVHELNHVSHFAIDRTEDDAFYEHTAVLVEKMIARDVSSYGVGIGDFQQHPERALDHMGTDYFEYGAAMWLMFLCEHVGDGSDLLVRQLWQEARVGTFVSALPLVLAEHAWSLPRFFGTFALWRYFTGPRSDGLHLADAAEWGETSLVPVQDRALGDMFGDVAAFGVSFHRVALGEVRSLDWQLSGPNAVLAAQALDADGRVVGEEIVREGRSGTLVLPGAARTLLVALTRVPLDYDPREDNWTRRRLRLKLTSASPVPRALKTRDSTSLQTTAEPVREQAPTSGCQASAPYLFPFLLLLRRRKRC